MSEAPEVKTPRSDAYSKPSLIALGEVFDGPPPEQPPTRSKTMNFTAITNQQRVARESPLVQFDLKMDSLRIFLENITITIGDHAKVLQDHDSQFRRRCIDP